MPIVSDTIPPPSPSPATSTSTRRNLKKLSITLPSLKSPAALVDSVLPAPALPDPSSPSRRRRPSVISLPAASGTLAHRRDEEGTPTVPYVDGPIQIIPGLWLGSEDNARDWKGLVERRIRSILNVAKEVVMPFDSAQPLRPFASTPNLKYPARPSDSTYYPAHLPSGRPSMHYLKLSWSHGQQELVKEGFPEAIDFTDAALARGESVLIHCQCGISRSATMVIALLMRAAAQSSQSVPLEIRELKGMQAAYAYVKGKSKWISPNMSLIYQLLEYERSLNTLHNPPSSDKSSLPDEEEWSRRRRMLDEPHSDAEHDDRESVEVMREARALDRAMEDRIVARKSSESSISSFGIGMGTAWRSRYSNRKRTGSVTSNATTGSTISENLVEEDEATDLLGVGGGFDDQSIRYKSSSEHEVSSSSNSPDSPTEDKPVFVIPIPTQKTLPRSFDPHPIARQSPSAPVWKTSFNVSQTPVTAIKASFDLSPRPPSKLQTKRRPTPLGITPTSSHSSEITVVATPVAPVLPPRNRTGSRKPATPPQLRRGLPKTPVTATICSKVVASTPSQTLFVFPPSPTLTTRTPSTMTLTSHLHSAVPFPSMRTPRVSTFRAQGRTRSFIGINTQPVPTIACSRVDARGWIGVGMDTV